MRLGTISLLIAGGLAIVAAIHHWPSNAIKHPPGMIAPDTPRQEMVSGAQGWRHGAYEILPLARFEITARVLSKAHYNSDRESDLSAYDLALGWGPMSDQDVLDKLRISQRNRWYHYRYSSPPIPMGEITRHSSNMHIIAANELIGELLAEIVKGHVVSISGHLVQARADDGWSWSSSLTRTDAGAHACELVWAEDLVIHD